MKTLILMQLVPGTGTNAEGVILFSVLNNHIKNNEKVSLSFKDATPLSSSFFNSSFGELVEVYGKDKLKEHVSIVNISRSQADMLTRYFEMIEQCSH